jgi:hypothetical protein
MLTFLFWNLNRKPLLESIVRLVERHRVDLLVLAECPTPPATMLTALNPPGSAEFHLPFSACEKVALYTRFSSQFAKAVEEDDHFTIQRLALPARPEVTLVAAHLPSKLYRRDVSQHFDSVRFARAIEAAEGRIGDRRTVVVGDLNMNPFEPGIVAADGLHAVMTKERAARGSRTVAGQQYAFFYNPMWSHFGDGLEGPPGTYHYSSAEPVCYFWNIFDQVLVRPELLDSFRNDDLTILSDDGTISFVGSDGVPDATLASDHLPVLFRLRL